MLRVGRTSREARSTAFQNVTFRIHRRRGSDQSLVNRVTLGTRRVGACATSRSLQARMREPTTIPRLQPLGAAAPSRCPSSLGQAFGNRAEGLARVRRSPGSPVGRSAGTIKQAPH
jgi:hypothetical protein